MYGARRVVAWGDRLTGAKERGAPSRRVRDLDPRPGRRGGIRDRTLDRRPPLLDELEVAHRLDRAGIPGDDVSAVAVQFHVPAGELVADVVGTVAADVDQGVAGVPGPLDVHAAV